LANTPSFDTVGIMARCVEDIALARAALLDGSEQMVATDKIEQLRIGLCRTPSWREAEPEAQACLELAAETLDGAGVQVDDTELNELLGGLDELAGLVSGYEFARTLAHERRVAIQRLSPALREGRMADGLSTSHADYRQAQVELERRRLALDEALAGLDLLLCLPAPGAAPEGLDHTGSAAFNQPWTTLHCPAVTLPVFKHSNGLPLGIQLVAARGNDARLLGHARALLQFLS
ncbi:MAG: amidase, partial [Gammaproteobacteria bacterium]|nr:amidase [Gammaproteobacteria bacterium]